MIDKTLPTCPRCVTRPCICWKLTQKKIEAERIALEGVTLLERYRNGKARLAIWLDGSVSVNRWHMIGIAAVAAFGIGYILLSFIMGNIAECKVL